MDTKDYAQEILRLASALLAQEFDKEAAQKNFAEKFKIFSVKGLREGEKDVKSAPEGEKNVNYTLYQRKDGRYEAKIRINKQQVFIACSKDYMYVRGKAEYAKKHLLEMEKKQLARQKKNSEVNISLVNWLYFFIENYKKNEITTWQRLEDLVRLHVKPYFNSIRLTDITGEIIDDNLSKIKSTKQRLETYNLINSALKKAVKLKKIKLNPCEDAERPTHYEEEGKALTRRQRKIFLKAIEGTPYNDILQGYLFSGCRAKEIYTIDVDFVTDTVVITGSKKKTNYYRSEPLFPELKAILLRRNAKPGEPFFTEKPEGITTFLQRLSDKIGFNVCRKDLRTTFGTICAENGIQPKTIAKWMGHSSVMTTNKYYIKVLSDFEKEEASKFNLKLPDDSE